jgi:hypothetical protein
MEINIKARSSISSNMVLEFIHMHKPDRSMRENGSMIYGMAKAHIISLMDRLRSRELGKEQS